MGQIGHALEGLDPVHLGAGRVDSVDGARVAESPQMSEHPATVLGLVGGETDDGYRGGIEETIQPAHRSWGITSEANSSMLSASPMS